MAHRIPGSVANKALVYKKLKTPQVQNGLFKLHTLSAFIGPRGSGKTNAAVLLAQRYQEDETINRVFIISPTFESNKIFELLNPEPGDVYTNMHTCLADIEDIVSKIGEMVEDYNESKELHRIYRKWLRFKKGKGEALSVKEFNVMENHNFQPGEKLPRPSPLVIIDDMSHSDIYSTSKKNPFINLCLRHRHLHKVGVSIFMLVQNYKSGVPKCLRQNIQQFFLWPTHDMTQLDAMYEEFANLCSHEDFIDMFQRCTAERHNFMTIDLNAKEPLLQFRKCFDQLLVPKSIANENELDSIINEPEGQKSKRSKHS